MNTIKFKLTLFASVIMFTACTKEDDFDTQDFVPMVFAEDFSAGAADNTVLDTPNWLNFAESGTVKWTEQV